MTEPETAAEPESEGHAVPSDATVAPAEEAPRQEPSRETLARILIAGAVGGFVSWVYSTTVGVPSVIESTFLAIAAMTLLGSVAAFLAIFLLAHTDLKSGARVAAVALAAGFAWKPVLDASNAYVVAQVEGRSEREVEEKQEEVESLRSSLPDVSGEKREQVMRQIARKSSDLLAMLPGVSDYALRARVETEARRTVEDIGAHGADAPEVATRAIGDIGFNARVANLPVIARAAENSVIELNRGIDTPEAAKEAFEALERIRPERISGLELPERPARLAARAEAASKAPPKAIGRVRLKGLQKELVAAAALEKTRGNAVRAKRFEMLSRKLDENVKRLGR